MKGIRIFVSSMILTVGATGAAMADALVIPYEVLSDAPSSAGIREVYGRVAYSVDFANDTGPNSAPDPQSVDDSLEALLRRQVTNAFGSADGNYVLTLTLLSGSEEIAKKALVSFSWKRNNFLFFTTNSTITGNLSRSGVLTDNFPVDISNNLLNVQLRLQRSDSTALDAGTFNEFSEQSSLASYETLQPALDLLPGVKSAVNVLSKVINSSDTQDVSNDVAMRFLDAGTDAPSAISFSLRGPLNRYGSETFKNGINVKVSFETEASLYKNFVDGKFENPSFTTSLQFAVVGTARASVQFEDALYSKRYDTIRTYFAALDRGVFPADATSISVCREIWDTLLSFFTVHDATLIYASYLRKYDFALDEAENAKRQCVDRYIQNFDSLSIPYRQIQIAD